MRRTGFTLIELLVVISVIGVLISILLPVLHMARQQAAAVACASNLKQVSLALMAYDQENRSFPHGWDDDFYHGGEKPPGDYVGKGSHDARGWWWFHFLAGMLGEDFGKGTAVWCPSRLVEDSGAAPNVLCGNYGVNRAICRDSEGDLSSGFAGRPLTLTQIRLASETLLITDSGYSLISWRGVTDAVSPAFENPKREGAFYVPGLAINQARSLSPSHETDAVAGRHPKRTVNVGFADGHVGRRKADDLLVEEIDGQYRNRTPLWLPKQHSTQ